VLIAFVGLMATASIGDAQNNQTRQVMGQKLDHSEKLLAALVTSDWDGLDRNARALGALTTQLGWQALQLPEFNKYTTAFQRSTTALGDAARARNGDAALQAYNALVGSCVQCHRYVARSRIVGRTPAP
jgi:hypothetical protein